VGGSSAEFRDAPMHRFVKNCSKTLARLTGESTV
jgi:hypothetical protein